MNEITVTEARGKLSRLIAEAKKSHSPLLITSRQGKAVLVSEEEWRAITETLHLMAVPGLADDIKAGMKTAVENCSEEPGW